jgi:uncharacterized phage protein (TIGR01671 family)
MKPKFRAWHKTWEEMGKVKRIRFDDDGNVTTVLFEGKLLGVNTKIDEIALMQSTGLKDKNDKEIFEGDILASETYPVNSAVEYRAKLGMWVNCLKEYSYYEYLGNVASDRKIIGNIYENPEFLEVE